MINRIAAVAAIAGVFAAGAPALAQPPHAPAIPSTNPVQPQPGAGTQNNPNGQPPIGRPSTLPDNRPSGMPSTRPGMPSARPSSPASGVPSVSPSTRPSSSPSSVPSVSPSALPSPSPKPVRSTSASQAKPARGTLTSVAGTTATIKTADGTNRTVAVSPKTAAMLKHRIGKTVVYRIVNGALVLVGKASR